MSVWRVGQLVWIMLRGTPTAGKIVETSRSRVRVEYRAGVMPHSAWVSLKDAETKLLPRVVGEEPPVENLRAGHRPVAQ